MNLLLEECIASVIANRSSKLRAMKGILLAL